VSDAVSQGEPEKAPEPSQTHDAALARRVSRDRRRVGIWLVGVYLLVVAMVMVGGTTRLTGSGLSMVDWQP
jgi:hypothetical protein